MSSFYSSSGGNGSSSNLIPEVTVDPISPPTGTPWVLRTGRAGSPIGLLLALTYTTDLYQFSYRTAENTTVRTTLA